LQSICPLFTGPTRTKIGPFNAYCGRNSKAFKRSAWL